MIKYKCLVCKKALYGFPCRIRKYCGIKCRCIGRRPPDKICPTCGKSFHPKFKGWDKLTTTFCSISCCKIGKNSPRYNGYQRVTADGYLQIRNIRSKKYETVHRLIMEYFIRRKLKKSEVVHHKNGNKLDNRIENLEIMTFSEHSFKHVKEHIKNGTWKNPNPKRVHGIS